MKDGRQAGRKEGRTNGMREGNIGKEARKEGRKYLWRQFLRFISSFNCGFARYL
jgi:hypothetical protein